MGMDTLRIPIGRKVDAFLNPSYFGEFIGTFIFIYTICLNVAQGTPMAAMSIGGMLMVMVYSTGRYVFR